MVTSGRRITNGPKRRGASWTHARASRGRILRLVIAAAVFVAVALSVVPAVAATTLTATVSGKVTNVSGQPIPDVTVELYRQPPGDGWYSALGTDTDNNGNYTLTYTQSATDPALTGDYAVMFDPPNTGLLYRVQWWNGVDAMHPASMPWVLQAPTLATNFTLADGTIKTGVNAKLKTFQGTMSGVVRDKSGHPLANISVEPYLRTAGEKYAYRPETYYTDANGRFSFAVDPGTPTYDPKQSWTVVYAATQWKPYKWKMMFQDGSFGRPPIYSDWPTSWVAQANSANVASFTVDSGETKSLDVTLTAWPYDTVTKPFLTTTTNKSISSAKHGKKFVVAGYISGEHTPAGLSGKVRVYFQKYSKAKRKYLAYGTSKKVTSFSVSGSRIKFKLPTKLYKAGKYKVYVKLSKHDNELYHRAYTSPKKSFSVK